MRANNKAIGKIKLAFLLAAVFVPPFCIVISGEEEWIGRLIATFIFLCVFIPILAVWLLNPRSQIIGKHAKLNEPRFKKAKAIVDIGLRSVLIVFIAIVLWTETIPLLLGTCSLLKGSELVRKKGIVTSVTVPFPLLDFLTQEITLEESGEKRSYRFMYPLRLELHEDRIYEFLVLPKSNLILEAKELPRDINGPMDRVNE